MLQLHHEDKITLQEIPRNSKKRLLKSRSEGMDRKKIQLTEHPLEFSSIHHLEVKEYGIYVNLPRADRREGD